MKSFGSICTLLFISTLALGQSFAILPEKPSPGDELTFTYNAVGTPLENEKNIEATAYLYTEFDLPQAVAVELMAANGTYTGKLPANAAAKVIFWAFRNEKGDVVDSGEAGYKVKFYQADKSEPVQGAYACLAKAYGSDGWLMEIERDPTQAIYYSQKEFKSYPSSKSDDKIVGFYASIAQRAKDEQALAEVKTIIASLKDKKKATESDWMMAHSLSQTLKDEEGAEAIAVNLRKKYRKGEFVKKELANAFYKEKELDAKVALFNQFKTKYGQTKEANKTMEGFARQLASLYGGKDEWTKFDQYFALLSDPSSKAGLLNNFAWNLAGEDLEKEAKNAEQAKKMSKQSLDLLQGEIANLAANKPVYLTEKQWKKQLESSYYMYGDTYALALYRTGDVEEALKYQEQVCTKASYVSGEMYERYALFMEKVKGGVAAEKLLEEKIISNDATTAMKAQHRRLFMANNSLEQAYDKYLAGLEKEATEKFKEELIAKMINDDAPDFTLVNLDGQAVSLADMKGKVVILDFWATWCGPCKASFPGMQKMVDKYKDNDKVAFLFINTWESAKDKKKSAKDFIDKNEYTFNVPMDEKDEVVVKYKVDGIPTKFVLDGNGKIRFKSVGFGGNDEALMTEMTLMIELAGGNKDANLSKADD
ncbi:MAG: TlpA disulfide reductase family protein [Saprospiraceae bacterium]